MKGFVICSYYYLFISTLKCRNALAFYFTSPTQILFCSPRQELFKPIKRFFIISGFDSLQYLYNCLIYSICKATPEEVAELTMQALTRHVPPAVPGTNFFTVYMMFLQQCQVYTSSQFT